MARLLILLALVPILLGSTLAMPFVPVVYLKDVGANKMYWEVLPIKPASFFCIAYPMHDREAPVRYECLSVDGATRDITNTVYRLKAAVSS